MSHPRAQIQKQLVLTIFRKQIRAIALDVFPRRLPPTMSGLVTAIEWLEASLDRGDRVIELCLGHLLNRRRRRGSSERLKWLHSFTRQRAMQGRAHALRSSPRTRPHGRRERWKEGARERGSEGVRERGNVGTREEEEEEEDEEE